MSLSSDNDSAAMSNEAEVVRAHLDSAAAALRGAAPLAEKVAALAGVCLDVLRHGGRIAGCGNGGSAAQAQHLAAELVVRLRRERRALASIALSADGVILTATGNDYGFEQVFARQVEALLRPGDLLILLTTSGRSPDLLAAAHAARQGGIAAWAFVGPSASPLASEVDEVIAVEGVDGAHVQETHLALGHALCELIDREVASDSHGN